MDDKTIKISDLDAIYQEGARNFTEEFLKNKAAKGESVVYSVGGQIVKLKAEEALRLYRDVTNGLRPEDMDLLSKSIPAELVQDLFDRLEGKEPES